MQKSAFQPFTFRSDLLNLSKKVPFWPVWIMKQLLVGSMTIILSNSVVGLSAEERLDDEKLLRIAESHMPFVDFTRMIRWYQQSGATFAGIGPYGKWVGVRVAADGSYEASLYQIDQEMLPADAIDCLGLDLDNATIEMQNSPNKKPAYGAYYSDGGSSYYDSLTGGCSGTAEDVESPFFLAIEGEQELVELN